MSTLLWVLLALIALERLVELAVSRRNEARLLDRGGRLVDDPAYPVIVSVHVLWFPAILAEAWLAPWAGTWMGTWPLLAAYAAAEALRLWTISTLGERWTTSVVVLEDAERIEEGPYRWLDHPNYWAVAVELAALPLAFALPVTAVLATVANGLAIRRRVRVEEQAWSRVEAATPADA